jgi:hypothetical protein
MTVIASAVTRRSFSHCILGIVLWTIEMIILKNLILYSENMRDIFIEVCASFTIHNTMQRRSMILLLRSIFDN